MGLAKNFKGIRPFNVPSIWEHTVAELLGIADSIREETFVDIKDWLGLDQMKLA